MKMLLIPVPDDAEIDDDMLGDLTSALLTNGLITHEVELDPLWSLKELDEPKYGLAKAGLLLGLLPISHNAFTEALAKWRAL